jgi:hypothetical protein
MLFTTSFWQGALERALKTFVQTALASLTAAVVGKTTAWDVDWSQAGYAALGVSLLAAFLSLATSVGNADFVAGGTTTVDVPALSTGTVQDSATIQDTADTDVQDDPDADTETPVDPADAA